ncbi:MAG TPA: NapC/NirT family cytochrome c [Cyclobacteriaceae bacterium]|nr:NapC/NirT family cytochrome c [Cyclobacteriaceae bacterium]
MKLPRSYYNTLSFIGTTVATVSLLMIGFLFTIAFFWEKSNVYLGLFIYIIIPVFLIIGLLLIPLGMLIEVTGRRKEKEYLKDRWPVIDLNITRYRNAILIFGVGTLVFLLLSGVGSYEAFHYTESVEFCGTVCHEVMKPEYTAYKNSPHARVACVDCHVGTGATWYVRSKLSGLRQVYAVLTNTFDRPIPTPITDLRPARETCEECHWPQKFYSRQLRNTKHYLTDSANTEWNISLQMKIGPQVSALGLSEGIHWHINPDVQVDYIPRSADREEIPWVKYTNRKTGEVIIFQETEEPLSEDSIKNAAAREMDCMDCHTRPSHHYYTPMEFLDDGLTNGEIAKDLPYIKKAAMDNFINPFTSTDTARMSIRENILNYYKDEHPEVFLTREPDIQASIDGILKGFDNNMFPEMGVSWDAYPDHIGHKTYEGCFRCHDDNHVSESGKVISRDCNLCHTIVFEGKSGEEVYAPLDSAMDFIHPKKLKKGWEKSLCSDCHRYLYN